MKQAQEEAKNNLNSKP